MSALTLLRQHMHRRTLAAYIVPSEDAHCNEYIARCDARRAHLSAFTGSAGLCVVTAQHALLWTDGRYWLQAANQLDPAHWALMKVGTDPPKDVWLNKVLAKGDRVGVDPSLISYAASLKLSQALAKSGIELVSVQENLVDLVWEDRPARPANPLIIHELLYSGESVAEKLDKVRTQLKEEECENVVVTALDEIAWVLNLRGSDIEFNPVFFSYLLISASDATLFIDNPLSPEVKLHLESANVKILPYSEISTTLSQLTTPVLIDGKCNLFLASTIKSIKQSKSIIQNLKCIKNQTELTGFKSAHIKDAAALCHLFAWMENCHASNTSITENDVADKAEYYRSQQPLFKGLSFDSISATGPNGAIIHYKPPKDSATVNFSQIFLLDSGAQYLDGTTDITRTMHFETPTTFEKESFTRVLKGHIAIDSLLFPRGVSGYQIDCIARMGLWKVGLEYKHGTGHGVGHFLNVHEGPQGIGFRVEFNETPLKEGMVLSNEPGYYKPEDFGIRIENLVFVKRVETKYGGEFLGFERLTMVPIQTKMMDLEIMTDEEIQWVDEYHKECWEKVSPLLEKGSDAYKWLEKETKALSRG